MIKYVMKQKILFENQNCATFAGLIKNWSTDKRLNPRSNFDQCTGVIFQCFVCLIYYCKKLTGQKSCESHLCAVVKDIF